MMKKRRLFTVLVLVMVMLALFTACNDNSNDFDNDVRDEKDNDTFIENGDGTDTGSNIITDNDSSANEDNSADNNANNSADLIGKTYVYDDIEFNSDGWTGLTGGLFEGTINAVLDELTDEFEEISITFKTADKAILKADNEKITVDYIVKENRVSLFNDKGEEMKYSFEISGKQLIMEQSKYGIGIKISLKCK